MSDQKPVTRPCPFCKEVIMAEALRCKHCQATILPAGPIHHGICPYCKESINPEAIRCKHCRTNLAPGVPAGWPQAYCRQGSAARRSYRRLYPARAGVTQATLPNLLHAEPETRAATCPPAILDLSPDGSGLGVWVLVASDAESCTYEYGGGIA
jgi:double zinc ribbon protein